MVNQSSPVLERGPHNTERPAGSPSTRNQPFVARHTSSVERSDSGEGIEYGGGSTTQGPRQCRYSKYLYMSEADEMLTENSYFSDLSQWTERFMR